jgi:DDE superfamily endonuclease
MPQRRKDGDHTLAALKSIRAARPGGYRLFVILDNLSANKAPAIQRWAQRKNVELCFTPTNESWANPIEAQFGPLRTFVMGTSDHPSHPVLARKLQAYLRWRNPTLVIPMSWPPSAASAPASAANGTSAGAAPNRKPHDQTGERSWSASAH